MANSSPRVRASPFRAAPAASHPLGLPLALLLGLPPAALLGPSHAWAQGSAIFAGAAGFQRAGGPEAGLLPTGGLSTWVDPTWEPLAARGLASSREDRIPAFRGEAVRGVPVALEVPAGAPAPASPGGRTVAFQGFLSAWRQDCPKDCGLPEAVEKNVPMAATLQLPDKPGEFRMARLDRTFRFKEPDGAMAARIAVYAVCPHGALPSAGDPCPSLYFQVQIELSGLAQALCSAALVEKDAVPFPVMACGATPSGSTRRLGLSLHRARLP